MSVEILQMKGNNFLWIDDYLWMWDIPTEQEIQKGIAAKAYGNVLVVGYGLGLVQMYCKRNPCIDRLLTLEKNKDVVGICRRVFGEIYGKCKVIDFYKFETDVKFDCIIGDIWKEIVPESLDEYKRFKNQAEKFLKLGGKIFAWGQDYFEYLIEKEKE